MVRKIETEIKVHNQVSKSPPASKQATGEGTTKVCGWSWQTNPCLGSLQKYKNFIEQK